MTLKMNDVIGKDKISNKNINSGTGQSDMRKMMMTLDTGMAAEETQDGPGPQIYDQAQTN